MYKIYKFKLCPTKEQEEFLINQIEWCRFVYNKVLGIAKDNYNRYRIQWNYYRYVNLLPGLKKNYTFLKQAIAQALQMTIWELNYYFKKFFRREAELPRFKKKWEFNRFSLAQNFKIKNGTIKLPKLEEPIKFIGDMEFDGIIKVISIERSESGEFFLILYVKETNVVYVLSRIGAPLSMLIVPKSKTPISCEDKNGT